MPKVYVSYNLPKESEEYKCAMQAQDLHAVCTDFLDHMRAILKYSDIPEKEYEIYEKIRDKFTELLNDRNVDLWY